MVVLKWTGRAARYELQAFPCNRTGSTCWQWWLPTGWAAAAPLLSSLWWQEPGHHSSPMPPSPSLYQKTPLKDSRELNIRTQGKIKTPFPTFRIINLSIYSLFSFLIHNYFFNLIFSVWNLYEGVHPIPVFTHLFTQTFLFLPQTWLKSIQMNINFTLPVFEKMNSFTHAHTSLCFTAC